MSDSSYGQEELADRVWIMVDDSVVCHATAHRGYLSIALCDSLGSFWARVHLALRVLLNRAEVTAISTFRSERRGPAN